MVFVCIEIRGWVVAFARVGYALVVFTFWSVTAAIIITEALNADSVVFAKWGVTATCIAWTRRRATFTETARTTR